MSKPIESIEDCIEYLHDMGLIGEVAYYDLINELDDLRKDQEKEDQDELHK